MRLPIWQSTPICEYASIRLGAGYEEKNIQGTTAVHSSLAGI